MSCFVVILWICGSVIYAYVYTLVLMYFLEGYLLSIDFCFRFYCGVFLFNSSHEQVCLLIPIICCFLNYNHAVLL
jgi:hypothetical protein